MNPIFEPFIKFINEKLDLSDEPRKQHRDRFQSLCFSDLTADELRSLDLSYSDLSAIHITFSSQGGKRYNAVHVNKQEEESYILLCGLDRDYYDFRAVSKQMAKVLPVIPRMMITDRADDISDVIELKRKVTTSSVAEWFQTFYSSAFDNALIAKVYYHDLLLDDFERIQIPEDKVSKGSVKRPMANVMKRHELDELCEEHAQKATGEIRETNIIAIHPYHDELEFNKKTEPPADNLHNLLMGYDKTRFGLALIDSYDHYALKSHDLVDKDRVGIVIFTNSSEGIPLHPEQLLDFRKTVKNYYGGTYGQQ